MALLHLTRLFPRRKEAGHARLHQSTSEEKHGKLLKRDSGDCRTFLCSVSEQLSQDSSIEVWETGGMGDWNRPRHLVLAVSSK